MLEVPEWMPLALLEQGDRIVETFGPGATQRIIWYDTFTTLRATSDEVPWCSAFACAMVETGGYTSTKSAAAISWMDWGSALDKPQFGCIAVFKRLGGNHVGFYCGERNHKIYVLGGNQGNSVSVSRQEAAALLGYRWPKEKP